MQYFLCIYKVSDSLKQFNTLILFVAGNASNLFAQSAFNRDTILVAAREIMKETTYCGLITIDSTGQP